MSETEELPETAEVEAELVLWRVFGLSDVYDDRPLPAWSIGENRGPDTSDRLEIVVGDLPDDLISALQQWRAQSSTLLSAHVGRSFTYAEVNEQFHADLTSDVPTQFLDPYPIWFTVRLSRRTNLQGVLGAEALWLTGSPDEEERITAFEADGNRYLDATTARLLAATYPLNLGRSRYADRRAFVMAPGRAAYMRPSFKLTVKDSGVRVGRSEGWVGAPTGALTKMLQNLPSGSGNADFGATTSKAAQWYTYSTSVADDEDLQRFVFAIAGLEVLIKQTQKAVRKKLLDNLSDLAPGLPIRDLLWPATSPNWVDRNLLANFAGLAAVHSPSTAQSDTESFRSIMQTRNDLFHGSENSDVRSRGIACKELLRRYLGLIA